jgi:hypothetical protein
MSDSTALALPSETEREALVASLSEVRDKKRAVEATIGVGRFDGDIPLTVLGFAPCAAQAINRTSSLVGLRTACSGAGTVISICR